MKQKDANANKIDGPWIPLPHALMKSPAWRSLSPAARVLYTEIELRYNGHNNGRIAFSVREAAEAAHVNKDTAGRALKSLQAVGLVRVVNGASFDTNKGNKSTEWEISRLCGRWTALKWQGPEDNFPVFENGKASHQKHRRKDQSEIEGPVVRNEGTDTSIPVRKEGTACPKGGDANSFLSVSLVRNEGTLIESAMEGAQFSRTSAPCLAPRPSSHPSNRQDLLSRALHLVEFLGGTHLADVRRNRWECACPKCCGGLTVEIDDGAIHVECRQCTSDELNREFRLRKIKTAGLLFKDSLGVMSITAGVTHSGGIEVSA